MTTDNYAPCPCGSGKKMKFCKCVDQPQEYEKIVRFIEGGQDLAAMDRVNQLLAKTPSAAWLLAIKSELALSLREFETFKDTVNRFLKLKPDNPLALTMRAFVAISENEPIENGVRLLLEGLAEARESLPGMVLDCLQVLCQRLRGSRQSAFRFYWVRLLDRIAEQSQLNNEAAEDTGLRQDNLLAMSPVYVPPVPAAAAWSERANEVIALISAFRYAQAETKLRSILRDFPDQSWPLLQLLEVQMVLLDQAGATTTARKLSGLRDMDEESRDYFAAMALELEEKQPGLSTQGLSRYFEVSSDDFVRDALAKLDFIELWPDEQSRYVANIFATTVKDEVPAKHLYHIRSTKKLANGESYLVNAGTLALFSRQTDKPSRVLVVMMPFAESQPIFDSIISALQPVADLEDPSAPRQLYYLDVMARPHFRKAADQDFKLLSGDEIKEAMADDFLSLPLPVLDNMTPLQAVEHESKRAMVRAILTHFDACHNFPIPPGTIELIYQRLQYTRPETNIDEIDQSEANTLLQLIRADVSKATDSQLTKLFMTALTLRIQRLCSDASRELLKRERSEELNKFRSLALQMQSMEASSTDEAVRLLEELEQTLVAQGQSVGEAIMRRFDLLFKAGREDEAREMLVRSFRTYPSDPYLLSVMQYMNQQIDRSAMGSQTVDDASLLNRMVTRRHEPEAEPVSSILLPGQSEAGSETGKSKLWLPGS